MTAYYNEIDPYVAQWLRNLIAANLIAGGDVDERSIVDVRADDLRGYTQCHFFAGIGGWSLALRLADWPDDRPVWTGSCPCQPFSAAGKGKAADDERHLWPAWFPLIQECRPPVVFGEQVEAAVGWGWVDAVFSDLEGEGYACGTAVLPACGVGAPHIRQRLWFVADARYEQSGRPTRPSEASSGRPLGDIAGCGTRSLADANGGHPGAEGLQRSGQHGLQPEGCGTGKLEHPEGNRRQQRWPEPNGWSIVGECEQGILVDTASEQAGLPGRARLAGSSDHEQRGASHRQRAERSAASSSFWSAVDWLPCRDGKARPVEPGTFPLASRIPARVGKLRAYGNAIVPALAAEFIAAACGT